MKRGLSRVGSELEAELWGGYFHFVRISRTLEDLVDVGHSLHLALGVFDGVHLGHQAVVARAVDAARREGGVAGLLTFDPHPIQVIAPEKSPTALLATLDHKQRIVEALGVECFVPLIFDRAMAELEAEDFIERLMLAPVKTIAVGEDWRFGHRRRGDVTMLKSLAKQYGYQLEAVAPVMFEGDRISSTRIRQAIRDGNLDSAASMLGRQYSLCAHVVEGRKLGRELGFPTANLPVGRSQLPPSGVWAVDVGGDCGGRWRGVANLGNRPTIDGGKVMLEVHLLDFSGDLYGRLLDVRFEKYLRPEQKFASVDALAVQIAKDVAAARENFGAS